MKKINQKDEQGWNEYIFSLFLKLKYGPQWSMELLDYKMETKSFGITTLKIIWVN